MKHDTRVWPPIKRPKHQELVDEAMMDLDSYSLRQLANIQVLRVYYSSRNRRPGRKL